MQFSHWLSFCLLCFFWSGFFAVPSVAQDVTFQDLSPGKLKVKVVKIEKSLRGFPSAIGVLEVSNPTSSWAEPLEFEVHDKGKGSKRKTLQVARVLSPLSNRAGRAIGPGESLKYWVNIPMEPKEISKKGVVVTQASFFKPDTNSIFKPGVLLEAPVVVGRILEAAPVKNFDGSKTYFTAIVLTNTSDQMVDAILRATFKKPKSGDSLVHCRLKPNQKKTWIINGPMLAQPGVAYLQGSDIKKATLIDWSVVKDQELSKHAKALQEAYEAPYRWPDPELVVTARYQLTMEGDGSGEAKKGKRKEKGSLKIMGSKVLLNADQGGEPLNEGWYTLSRVTEQLARQEFDKWLDGKEVALHKRRGKTLILTATPQRKGASPTYYWVEGGVIVRECLAAEPMGQFVREYVVSKKGDERFWLEAYEGTRMDAKTNPPRFFRYEYEEVQGVFLPVRAFQEMVDHKGKTNLLVKLELSDVKILGKEVEEGDKSIPTGPFAEAVRDAWDSGYRYPKESVTLSGRIVATNSGKDASWLGNATVSGTFRLADFRGSSWGDWEVVLDQKFPEEVDLALRGVVIDRMGMYSGRRDFAGREDFDTVFAGATIEKVGKKFVVKNCRVESLEIKKGRLAAYSKSGVRYEIGWKKMDGKDVPIHHKAKPESMTYKRERFGDWWIPVDVTMKDVFEDWGSERIVLSDLVVE